MELIYYIIGVARFMNIAFNRGASLGVRDDAKNLRMSVLEKVLDMVTPAEEQQWRFRQTHLSLPTKWNICQFRHISAELLLAVGKCIIWDVPASEVGLKRLTFLK